MTIKYPDVHVRLTGQDGNAFNVMGLTTKAMRRAGVAKEAINTYMTDAMSGDYNHLLTVTMQTVDVS
jgi:hypothetical protein